MLIIKGLKHRIVYLNTFPIFMQGTMELIQVY